MPKANNLFYVTRTDPQTGEMVSAQDKRKVFVSYKKDDNRVSGVRDITVNKILSTVDCAVWFDDALTPGVDYKEEIINAISQCDAVVLVLSRNILKSDFVWGIEVAAAQEQKKGIIPVAFDIGPEDYSAIEEKLGRRQILRWPTGDDEEAAAEEQMKFDEAFERSLDQFVINADLALRVEQFFASGKHNTPACYLNADEHYLMGFGCMRGLGTARDTEKGVALLDSVVNSYGDDPETREVKGNAALELSKSFYDSEDFKKSLFYAETGARLGNSDAMNKVGVMYYFGNGVEQDKEKAVEWCGKAAELGHAGAMSSIGFMHFGGREMDEAKGAEWFISAAELGNKTAMLNLGELYRGGIGVERDGLKAVEWYTKAAELGETKAMRKLGDMYLSGDGVEQDKSKALEWYTKAAELGETGVMYKLGSRFLNGDGFECDKEKAAEWYTKAAELGEAAAMYELGTMYENGDGVEKDKVKALKWYTDAAEIGDLNAMRMLALWYDIGENVAQDAQKAIHWYTKAAERGDVDSMESLGNIYKHGWGIKKDKKKAMEWFRKAEEISSYEEGRWEEGEEVVVVEDSPTRASRRHKAARKAARADAKAEKQRLRAERKAARRSGK